MTYVMTGHLAYTEALPADPARVGEVFDDVVSEILPHGGSGQSLWFGPEGADEDLRVDIDVDVDRAALTWLADDTIGIELEPGRPIIVMWSIDAPKVTVPGTLARVSIDTARRAVIE